MTAYDETRCYAPTVGDGRPLYCGSPAKRTDDHLRPLCGRCKDPEVGWTPDAAWPFGVRQGGANGEWTFLRNPPAPKPLPATIKAVNSILSAAGVKYVSPYRSGLKVRQRYDGSIAVETFMPLGGVRLGDADWELKFAKARDALAARGLTLVMVDDRHATVTETKP